MKYRIETERADLFDVNMIIIMRVELEKTLPFDKMKAAFEEACKCHEVLTSKIVIEESGQAFYIDNASVGSSFSQSDLSLKELIKENERLRFKIEKGEFIRAFALPEGLVFMMHHLAGDGKSLLYFIETFMKCLSGQPCAFVPFKNLTLKELPKNSSLPFLYKILVKNWNRRWSKVKRLFSFEDMDKEYQQFWKNHETKIEIKRYEKDQLEGLLKNAKQAGVSLTSYLITDLIKNSAKKMDIGLAVDGRLDKNRAMGNQATGIAINYKYKQKLSFEENAKKVQRLLKEKLSDDGNRFLILQFMGQLDPTLIDTMNLEHADYFHSKVTSRVAELLGYGKRTKDLSITNLTRADIPLEYGDNRIKELVFIPPVVSYGKNIIGIVTCGNNMNIAKHEYCL
ncbi:MAG: hypothetical protein K5930_12105 [Treponemataceae bacterium]|nr:hypothetical protein [Treponemataceae bacterium]